MNKSKVIMLIISGLFLTTSFSSSYKTTDLGILESNDTVSSELSKGIDTSWVVNCARKQRPIVIDGNKDFQQQAKRNDWPGDGSEFDPYIIEYIELSMPINLKAKKFRNLPAAITIKNTDVHFIIRYCVLTSVDGNYHGIHLTNVMNGFITHNIITNFASAIFLDGSSYNTMTFNTIDAYNDALDSTDMSTGNTIEITGSMSHGIFLDPSDYNVVEYNQISDYTGNGLYVMNSSFNQLMHNDIDNSYGENGVFLAGSNENSITYNEIYGYASSPLTSEIRFRIARTGSISHGIFLDPSDGNYVAYNNISDFTAHGVYLQESDSNTVKQNNIDSSNILKEDGSGIFLENSDDNILTENTLYASETSSGVNLQGMSLKVQTGSLSHGIFLDPSDGNVITNNYISDFTGNGLYLFDSDENLVQENEINNNLDSLNSNGVFLEGSHLNIITDNDIFSSIGSSTLSSDIRFKMSITGSMSHGIFLDPSNNNTISNNRISGYDADGLYLLDSDFNDVFDNDIDNSLGENGVFLNGSNWNNVSYNDIWGDYSSSSTSSSSDIRFKMSITGSMSHGIFLDPSNNNTITGNEIQNITGDGVFVLSSGDNEINYNEISGNEGAGIHFEDSWDSSITNNIIYNDELYGIFLDNSSNWNLATENDLIGNNIGSSQIYDDGIENLFTSNFLIDHDNRDGNNDNTSDAPYDIDGSADNFDPYPSALPVQPLNEIDLNLANLSAWVDYESETINLKNEGQSMNVKIKLPDGYSVTNIDISSVFTDGYPPYNYADVESVTYSEDGKLIVKFNRTALVEYLNDILPYTPIEVQLNVTGWLNGHFLSFSGGDTVTVLNKDPEEPILNFIMNDEQVNVENEPPRVLSFVSTSVLVFTIAVVTLTLKKRRFKRK